MWTYISVRVLQSIVVIILVAIASFAIFRILPGDPVAALSGEGEAISEERRKIIEERLGLNKSVPEQMVNWLGDIVTSGDFGQSTLTNRDIGPELLERLQNTLHVGVATIVGRHADRDPGRRAVGDSAQFDRRPPGHDALGRRRGHPRLPD